jgi:hypothetical protein
MNLTPVIVIVVIVVIIIIIVIIIIGIIISPLVPIPCFVAGLPGPYTQPVPKKRPDLRGDS